MSVFQVSRMVLYILTLHLLNVAYSHSLQLSEINLDLNKNTYS